MLSVEDLTQIQQIMNTSVSEAMATAIAPLSDQIDYLARTMPTREELEELHTELGERKKDMDRSLNISDKTVGALEGLRLEYGAVLAQLARQERWFHLLANKIGVTLAY